MIMCCKIKNKNKKWEEEKMEKKIERNTRRKVECRKKTKNKFSSHKNIYINMDDHLQVSLI